MKIGLRAQMVFGTVIAIAVVASFITYLDYDNARSTVEERVRGSELPAAIDSVASQVDRTLEVPVSVSRAMSHNQYLTGWVDQGEPEEGLKEVTQYLSQVDQYSGAAAVYYVSNTTLNYYTDAGRFKTLSRDAKKDGWFFNFGNSGLEYELSWDIAEQTGMSTVFVNYRLDPRHKDYRGVVGIGLSVAQLTEVIRSYRIGDSGVVYLVDPEGVIRVHPNRAMEGKKAADLAWASQSDVLLGEHPSEILIVGEGQDRSYVGSRPLLVPGWHLVGEVRRAEVLGPIQSSLLGGVGIAVVLAALIALLAATFGGKITGKILNLAQAVEAKNEEMNLVLSNVQDGLVTVGLDGHISHEMSTQMVAWFGRPKTGQKVWDYLYPHDASGASWMELALESVADGFLPPVVALDQMPKRVVHEDRTFQLDYAPIEREVRATPEGDPELKLERVLLVVSDITEKLANERSEREQRELGQVFAKAMSDRGAVVSFVREGQALVAELTDAEEARTVTLRHIHTLKGICALQGLASIAELCHHVETACAERNTAPNHDELRAIEHTLERLFKRLEPVLGAVDAGLITLTRDEYRLLSDAAQNDNASPTIIRAISELKYDSSGVHLQRLADEARRVAKAVGKAPLTVHVETDATRLDPERFGPLLSAMIHMVRNSVDHGIETPEEREQTTKPHQGQLWLRCRTEGETLTFEVQDDGRGLAFDKIRARAEQKGLPAESEQDLIDALFSDGFSSKDEVSELSGRGVGLGAVKAECEALGGALTVHTSSGHGTTFRLQVPAHCADSARKVG